jgi:hypothetical protein
MEGDLARINKTTIPLPFVCFIALLCFVLDLCDWGNISGKLGRGKRKEMGRRRVIGY